MPITWLGHAAGDLWLCQSGDDLAVVGLKVAFKEPAGTRGSIKGEVVTQVVQLKKAQK